MADMTNIVDFNNSDGLPPWVIQKLNHNFWGVVQKIIKDQIVMVASVTEPSPRTDETLWYKTDTGDLYIWREFEGEWGWDKIDIGYIHVDLTNPVSSTYSRKNEYIWISTGSSDVGDPIYVWIVNPVGGATTPSWVPLGTLMVNIMITSFTASSVFYAMMSAITSYSTKDQWEHSAGFCQAVKDIIANPSGYPLA